MAMTDITFIFVFFPLSLLTMACKTKCQKYILLILSLFYYACGSPQYFVQFMWLLILNIGAVHMIQAVRSKKKIAFPILLLGIMVNAGVLFYYKYFGFAVTGVDQALGTLFATKDLLLPMGISFFSFKAISLMIDVYKGTVLLEKNPVHSALYLTFFGQIASGPICRYNDFYKNIDYNKDTKAIWELVFRGGDFICKWFHKKGSSCKYFKLDCCRSFFNESERYISTLIVAGLYLLFFTAFL